MGGVYEEREREREREKDYVGAAVVTCLMIGSSGWLS
jgi:hypothetical protein